MKHRLTVRQREVLEVMVQREYAILTRRSHVLTSGRTEETWRLHSVNFSKTIHAATARSLINRDFVVYDNNLGFHDDYVITPKGKEALNEQS